jgi:hypothetical protein
VLDRYLVVCSGLLFNLSSIVESRLHLAHFWCHTISSLSQGLNTFCNFKEIIFTALRVSLKTYIAIKNWDNIQTQSHDVLNGW